MKFSVFKFFQFGIFFSFGFLLGKVIHDHVNHNLDIQRKVSNFKVLSTDGLYDETMSYDLFHQVNILCWIFTHPDNHIEKTVHVKQIWGKRCNKILFISTQQDPVLGTIAIPVENGREQLWNKTIKTYEYVHKYHLQDADWFMRLDDDNYAIIENIRYLLYQYRSQTALYIGHRFTQGLKEHGHFEGYMAGGGYILSKKALEKLVEEILPIETPTCTANRSRENQYMDDLFTGGCLAKQAIFVNEMDELNQKRFFPIPAIGTHIGEEWYHDYLWYNYTMDGLSCCSDTFCAMHYTDPFQMYTTDYLVYQVHPFGIDKNSTEKLPKKLSLNEIIAASDVKGVGTHYTDHEPVHHLSKSEIY